MYDRLNDLKNELEYQRQSRPDSSGTAAIAWAIEEIEHLRRQWTDGVSKLLAQVGENKKFIDDANARLDRAGL